MYQLLNVSIITVSESKKGMRIITERKTLLHESVKSNMSCRILQAMSQRTKQYKREKEKE